MGDVTNGVVKLIESKNIMTVKLNRPKSHNALTPEMIQKLKLTFQDLDQRDDVRAIILTGAGRSFCAGADLAYMRETSDYSFEENASDGQAIFDLMLAIDQCQKPVIGRVNGAVIGGGIGLVSCCDIVISVEQAIWGLSETRIGLVPAVISPFVLAKIGVNNGRELFLTGERFDAHYAKLIGLVNFVAANEDELDEKVNERVSQLLLAAPGAQAAAKKLVQTVAYQPKEAMRTYTTELLASRRASEEGREGMGSFLEKRKPNWQQ